jgi:hypothetical protein
MEWCGLCTVQTCGRYLPLLTEWTDCDRQLIYSAGQINQFNYQIGILHENIVTHTTSARLLLRKRVPEVTLPTREGRLKAGIVKSE